MELKPDEKLITLLETMLNKAKIGQLFFESTTYHRRVKPVGDAFGALLEYVPSGVADVCISMVEIENE